MPEMTPIVASLTTAEIRDQIVSCKDQIQTKHREIVMLEGAIQILQNLVDQTENIAARDAMAKAMAEAQQTAVIEAIPAPEEKPDA